jgi:hypothetical protein
MQKITKRFACLITLFVLIVTNSCKKDIVTAYNSDANRMSRLSVGEKVQPAEVAAWLQTLPSDFQSSVQTGKAKQRIINYKHVIQIPIGINAALYFAKEQGILKVWAYKWDDEKPVEKLFTGRIASYSFQDNQARLVVYDKGIITSGSGLLTVSGFNIRVAAVHKPTSLDASSDGSGGAILSKIWCWITGGSWNKGDGTPGNYGANGEVGIAGCEYPVGDEELDDGNPPAGGGGGALTIPPGVSVSTGSGAPTNPNPPDFIYDTGTTLPPYGGGDVWVSVWVPSPDSGGGCPINGGGDLGGGGTGGDSLSNDGSTECSNGSTGEWVTYMIPQPVAGVDYMAPDNDDIDDGSGTYGNYDNTTYPNYDQSNPWPTVANVISKSSFLPYDSRTCLLICKDQIALAGYSISALDAPGQTIQIYTEAGGVDLANAKLGVAYLNYALQKGIPVIVGVDDAPGGQGNADHSTNHFIVIVGMGTDTKGNFYRFYDSSTKKVADGTSDNNKLYYNDTTGLITGSTQSQYGTSASYMHPYKVTQIRKSK